MRLSDLSHNKDNNFNVLRMAAASAVLITHSFALATGSGDAEPLRTNLGMTMGSISVDVFFITSGFLVTGSLLSNQSTVDFFWGRVLRIFPALIVMLVLTVVGLGCYFTNLPYASYLADPRTYTYLIKCATLVTGISYTLPGVFQSNPWQGAVNGSLWTLPKEIYMYGMLAITWILVYTPKISRFKYFELAIITNVIVSCIFMLIGHFSYNIEPEGQFTNLFFMFFSGATFQIIKQKIRFSRPIFWALLSILLTSALIDRHLFFVIYSLTLSYIVFYVAYVPTGFIRRYNALGDYSYGIYIYAFPIQQSIAAALPEVSALSIILIATPLTVLMATFSWHLIEKRALGMKHEFSARTHEVISQYLDKKGAIRK